MSIGIGTIGLAQSLLGKDLMENLTNHEAFFLGALERDIQKHTGSKQLTYSDGTLDKHGAACSVDNKIMPTSTVIFRGGELTESGKITNQMLIQGKVLVITNVL